MLSLDALLYLDKFLAKPTPDAASYLVCAPSLYMWLAYAYDANMGFSDDVIEICSWLRDTGLEVFDRLAVYDDLGVEDSSVIKEEDWKKVSVTTVVCASTDLSADGLLLQHAPDSPSAQVPKTDTRPTQGVYIESWCEMLEVLRAVLGTELDWWHHGGVVHTQRMLRLSRYSKG